MSCKQGSELSELIAVVAQVAARLKVLEGEKGAGDGAGGEVVEKSAGGDVGAGGGAGSEVQGSVGGDSGVVVGKPGEGVREVVGKRVRDGVGAVDVRGKKKVVFGDFEPVEVRGEVDSGVSSDGLSSVGCVSARGSERSWSDELDEEKPLGYPGQPLVGPGETRSVETSRPVGGSKFFKDHVRTDRVRAFLKFLRNRFSVVVPVEAMQELALVSYTTGTVPDAFVNGRRRITAWAAVGDAAMALVVVDSLARAGQDVAAVQAVKSSLLSNAKLSAVCVSVGLAKHVSFAPGVNAATAKSGADAFEALCGVLFRYAGLGAVQRVLLETGFVAGK